MADKIQDKQEKQEKPQAPEPRAKVFDEAKVEKVLETLQEYKRGKTSIDQKATENQEWWRLRHWGVISGTNEGGKAGETVGSAWAVNSILNKHADIMDSFPKPNVLPRDADDEGEAEMLSKILPVIEAHTDAEKVYSDAGYDFLLDGTAVTGVFWDTMKHYGLGDIVKTNIDIHNVYWQPGISDIQDSKYFFNVSLANVDDVRAMYPDYADQISAHDSGLIDKYLHDDQIDTTEDVEIIDCYYKKLVMKPIAVNAGDKVVIHQAPETQLHLAKIISGVCVFCSEDEPGYERGYYAHGKYPFVFRALFPVKDSPCGFGYLDIMKNPQKDIDRLDQAIVKNALMNAKPRFWVKKNADINKEDFADWNVEMVEVGSGDLGNAVKQIDVNQLPAIVETHLEQKIDELKETSGNRDFSQGSTQSGVTAASAIAALQEAGSKLSRDVNKTLYRAAREEYELEIELIRQFYTEDRSFRVDTGMGGYAFVNYSNAGIVPQDIMLPDGNIRYKESVFDIEISAEKESPFSRAAQNETAKELYGLGLFAPGNAASALVCLDMMDFEGKDKVKQQIQQNDIMQQQYQQMAQIIVQTMPEVAVQMGLVDPTQAQTAPAARPKPSSNSSSGSDTAEDRAARKSTDTTRTHTARLKAAKAAEVK